MISRSNAKTLLQAVNQDLGLDVDLVAMSGPATLRIVRENDSAWDVTIRGETEFYGFFEWTRAKAVQHAKDWLMLAGAYE